MAWWLCTISRQTPSNWEHCKRVSLFGVPGDGQQAKEVREGDGLLVWMGGKGFIALAKARERSHVPRSAEEAPWAGGRSRFQWVVPFDLTAELQEPVSFSFRGQLQDVTNFNKSMFHKGFTSITDASAQIVVDAIHQREGLCAGDRADA